MSFLGTSLTPTAVVLPYAGVSAPVGWLICNGNAISRTTYANLFAAIGTQYGSGDGSTTFNLPDYRWTFLRGFGPNLTATSGSGTAASNNITITGHGFNRSGIKIRITSATTLPGANLAVGSDYWIIVVDANTIAFASSKNNATSPSPTKIVLTGTFSAVAIAQYEDPDAGSRVSNATGGNSGVNVGSAQLDELKSHTHTVAVSGDTNAAASNQRTETGGTLRTTSATGGNETRPTNITVNYIIKF